MDYRPLDQWRLNALTGVLSRGFDRIVSLSTIEHFGERTHQEEKPLLGWRRMREWLLPDGRMLATIPAGFNPWVDAHIPDFEFEFLRALRRDGDDWVEGDPADVPKFHGTGRTDMLLIGYA